MSLSLASHSLFNVSMGIYLLAFLGYLIWATSQKRKIGTISTSLLVIGLISHSIGLVLRWQENHQTGCGYVPLSNM